MATESWYRRHGRTTLMAANHPAATRGPAGACLGRRRDVPVGGKARRPAGTRCRDVGGRRRRALHRGGGVDLQRRHATASRRSGSHTPTGAPALVLVTAPYGAASHPSADQERGLTESVAA